MSHLRAVRVPGNPQLIGSPRGPLWRYGPYWWNERLDAALIRVMEGYADIDKASRVTGAPAKSCATRLVFLNRRDLIPPEFDR